MNLCIHAWSTVIIALTCAVCGAAGGDPGYEAAEPIVFTKASCAVKSDFMRYRSFADPLVEVLLPTGYDKAKRYRTLYLLHPTGKSEPCLRYLAALRLHDKHDLVCVSVGVFDSHGWTGLDVEGKSGSQQAQYLIQAVVPLVERAFATSGRSQDRLLLGFGGAGEAALRLVLGHPNVFGAAGAIEPTAEIWGKRMGKRVKPKPGTLAALRPILEAQSVAALAKANAAAFAESTRLVLLAGGRAGAEVDAHAALFSKLGMRHVRGEVPCDGEPTRWETAWLGPAVDRLLEAVGAATPGGPGTPLPLLLPLHSSVVDGARMGEARAGFIGGRREVCHIRPVPGDKPATDLEVVLPTDYDPAKRYRVLYLLSCCGSKDVDSLREILHLKLHDRYDLICVLPEGRNEDHLKNVVVPYIEKRYSTLGNAEGRLLLGFSKTGTGAFRLIFDNPDYFGYAIGWDGPFVSKTGKNAGSAALVKLARDRAAPFTERARLVLGGRAFWKDCGLYYHKELEKLGIKHHFEDVKRPGHSWLSGWVESHVAAMMEQVEGGTDE